MDQIDGQDMPSADGFHATLLVRNMEPVKRYRLVGEELTSHRGEVSWTIGEWMEVGGYIACGSNGLHASASPRDSLANVYGRRWFISEARGAISRGDSKFAAAEMRLVAKIPLVVMRKFAVWCAADCLASFKGGHVSTEEWSGQDTTFPLARCLLSTQPIPSEH